MKSFMFTLLLSFQFIMAQPAASFAKVIGLVGIYDGFSTFEASNHDILACGSYNNTLTGGTNALICRMSTAAL